MLIRNSFLFESYLINLNEEEEDLGIDTKLSALKKEESPMEKDFEAVMPVSENDEGILNKPVKP